MNVGTDLLAQMRALVLAAGSIKKARKEIALALQCAQKNVRDAARITLRQSGDGLACAQQISTKQDEIAQAICALVMDGSDQSWPSGLCICAIGGYGRGELAPGSDLDILFLVAKNELHTHAILIEQVLYLLWDMGLHIGHAVRTHADCLELAAKDHTIATSLMDIRVLVGSTELPQRVTIALRRAQSAKTNRQFIAAKLQERDVRHKKQGPTRYLVEPNVKAGKGGLRDLQSLIWIARRLEPTAFLSGGDTPKFFSEREYQRFVRAHQFLWTVRCWLHFVSGQAEDRLSFDLQPQMAKALQYRDRPGKPQVERMMKAYFLTTREVGFLTRMFCTKLEERAAKKVPAGLSRLSPGRHGALSEPGFALRGGRLDFKGRRPGPRGAAQLVRLFLIADKTGVDIHPDALSHIRRTAPELTAKVREDPDLRAALMECLTTSQQPEASLRLMSEASLLGKLIPEFGRITAKTQFNMYHSYTVDEHTLRAIGVLKQLENGAFDVAGLDMKAILAKSANRHVLYLAMLLHDTGKGQGDQEIEGGIAARTACRRLGLSPAEIDLAGWLVEHHLLFSDTAQGRDLGDMETITKFAETVGSLERLRLLFMLTVADIDAVGPGVWTGWKGQLMAALYVRTQNLFLGRRRYDGLPSGANPILQQQKALTKALAAPGFAKAWIADFRDTYWLEFSQSDLIHHAKMVLDAKTKDKNATYAVHVRPGMDDALSTALVWAKDQEGLFANLCAIATSCGAAIAAARVLTSESGKALDILYLHDGHGGAYGANNPRALSRIHDMLVTYFEHGIMPNVLHPPRSRRHAAFSVMAEVVIDNETSKRATLIECSGADAPGLLHILAQSLNQCRANIHSAHIVTYGERAVDIFYVNEFNGDKITNPRRLSHIRAALMDVLMQSQTSTSIEQARASQHR